MIKITMTTQLHVLKIDNVCDNVRDNVLRLKFSVAA